MSDIYLGNHTERRILTFGDTQEYAGDSQCFNFSYKIEMVALQLRGRQCRFVAEESRSGGEEGQSA